MVESDFLSCTFFSFFSGIVEGDLVYVNYGRVEDFDELDKLDVNVTGKICIVRYGKIFRGNKVNVLIGHIPL